jgi:RNA polymerase sporulation-specific sigma factor
LNCYVSIYDEQGGSATDTLLSKTEKSPEELFLDDEAYGDLRKSLFLELSALEKKVMLLKMQAYDYREIAKVLDKSPKAIDNAIQRIRAKAKKVMTDKRNET